jgi:hypothetical protein
VDGGQHGQQARYDENRTQELQAAGFYVLRFWDNEVLKEIESVKEKIWLVVQGLESHPPPNLPLEGGGVRKVPLEGGGVKKVAPEREKEQSWRLCPSRGRMRFGNFHCSTARGLA